MSILSTKDQNEGHGEARPYGESSPVVVWNDERTSGWWCNNYLEKYDFVSWDDDIPIYEMENKISLKPPTRHVLLWDVAQSDHILILEPHLKF